MNLRLTKVNGPPRRISLLLLAIAQTAIFACLNVVSQAALGTSDTASNSLLGWDTVSVKSAQDCTSGSGMQLMKDGVHIFCLPLRAVVQIAWAISEGSRVLGLPPWASDGTFNIDAKVGGEDVVKFGKLSIAQRNQMLQAMLQYRFKLRAHIESRELPAYDLVVAKGGPRLKEATADEAEKPMLWRRNRGEIDSTAMGLSSLPSVLAAELDRPVVNKTGLAGKYDYTLQFTPAMGAVPNSEAPSIFTAVEDELGLKLVPSKALLPVLIIDNVERPDAN